MVLFFNCVDTKRLQLLTKKWVFQDLNPIDRNPLKSRSGWIWFNINNAETQPTDIFLVGWVMDLLKSYPIQPVNTPSFHNQN